MNPGGRVAAGLAKLAGMPDTDPASKEDRCPLLPEQSGIEVLPGRNCEWLQWVMGKGPVTTSLLHRVPNHDNPSSGSLATAENVPG